MTKNRDISQILDQNTLHTAAINATAFTTTGFRANATHVVATSNSSGQTFGNTIARWVITANTVTVAGGVSPDSNTLGTALGSTTQRWVITANSVSLSGAITASGLNLPEGGVINWDSGDVTITQTADALNIDYGAANPVLEMTNSGGGAGNQLKFHSNSPSPANNDLITYIESNGRDSANNIQNYAQIWQSIADTTSGAEDGAWQFLTTVNGATAQQQLYMRSGVSIGGSGTAPSGGTGCLALQGGQIEFPATQNASSGGNTLDDYEEGTYTPVYTATGSTFNYGAQSGYYIKVGQSVNFTGSISLAATGNTLAANPLSMSIPFAATGSPSAHGACKFWNTTTALGYMGWDTGGGIATILFSGTTAITVAHSWPLNANQVGHPTNTTFVVASGCYRSTS